MATLLCEFVAYGRPRPKGSWNWERGKTTPASKAEPEWSRVVGWTARAAYDGEPVERGYPVALDVQFRLSRPKRKPRWWAGGRLIEPSITYDLDKLTRSLFDALSGVIYLDDRQVVKALIEKVYVDDTASEGVRVRAYAADERRFDDLWLQGG